MIEELSVRENRPRKDNILVNSKNLHISLKTEYIDGGVMV